MSYKFNTILHTGTIVELGVVDGLEHSTSYFFEKGMNWTTILTEADPISYELISENRVGEKVKAMIGRLRNEALLLPKMMPRQCGPNCLGIT